MATCSLRSTMASTSNTTTYTSSSFTPPGSALLVVFVNPAVTVDANSTLTASANGITFHRASWFLSDASNEHSSIWVSNQLTPASPAAMTITAGFPNDSATGCGMHIYAVTGVTKTGAAAVRQVAGADNNLGASDTPTVTFAQAPASGNPVIGYVANNTNPATQTPPTGFTESTSPAGDSGFSTPSSGTQTCYINSDSPQTVTWNSTSTRGDVQAIEIDAAVAGPAYSGSASLSGSGTLTATGEVPPPGMLTLVGSSSGSAPVSPPTGTLNNDYVVVIAYGSTTATASPLAPTNWTTITETAPGTAPSVRVAYRQKTAFWSGIGSWTGAVWIQMLTLRNVVAFKSGVTASGSGSTINWASVADVAANSWAIRGLSHNRPDATIPYSSGHTGVMSDGTEPGYMTQYLKDSGAAASISLSRSEPWSNWQFEAEGAATGESYTASVALSGSGTLSAVGTPAPRASAGLSGSGTATASAKPAFAITAATGSTGTLSPAGKPAATASVGLSGSGTLTAAGVARPAVSVGLSGSGTLSATGEARFDLFGTASFSGSGTLSAAGAPRYAVAVGLSGSGALTLATTLSVPGSAAFSGSGALSTAARPAYTANVGLSGSGALSAAGQGSSAGTAAYSGSGQVVATGKAAISQTVAFSGSGALSATQTRVTTGGAAQPNASGTLGATGEASVAGAASVSLSASGSLTATSSPAIVGNANLSGEGSSAMTLLPRLTTSAGLSASGSLAPTPTQITAVGTAGFAGSGSLSASGSGEVHVSRSVALDGSGSLSSSGKAAFARDVALSGSGSLATATKPALAVAAVTGGSGTLSATAQTRATTAVGLAGSGSLTAVGLSLAGAQVQLEGSGSLSASGQLQTVISSAQLSGSGTLVATGSAPAISSLATLTAAGFLSGAGAGHARGDAALGASGTLAGLGTATKAGTAEFAGSGSLSATGIRYGGEVLVYGKAGVWTRPAPAALGALALAAGSAPGSEPGASAGSWARSAPDAKKP